MGQRFYHRFAVIQNLSTPLVLGMDFMMRASVVIQVPSRTVVLSDVPEAEAELEGVDVMAPNQSLLSLQDGSSLDMKVDGAALNEGEKFKLGEFLRSFAELFDGHLGHTSIVEHTMDTGQARPIHLAPYRTSPAKKELIERQIDMMLAEGIIEPASGLRRSLSFKKPSGEPRFCVDYRGLNRLTVKNLYPLPKIDEYLDFLARGNFVSTIDLDRGY